MTGRTVCRCGSIIPEDEGYAAITFPGAGAMAVARVCANCRVPHSRPVRVVCFECLELATWHRYEAGAERLLRAWCPQHCPADLRHKTRPP